MKTHPAVPVGYNRSLVASRTSVRGQEGLDLREWRSKRGRSGSLSPSRDGIGLPLSHLPALLSVLHAVEADALAAGLLTPADYEAAGLKPPTRGAT